MPNIATTPSSLVMPSRLYFDAAALELDADDELVVGVLADDFTAVGHPELSHFAASTGPGTNVLIALVQFFRGFPFASILSTILQE